MRPPSSGRIVPMFFSLDVEIRSLLRTLRSLKLRHALEAIHTREEIVGEAADREVVALHALVVAAACLVDAVLRTLFLHHQRLVVFAGLQVGVALRDGDEAGECLRHLVLCLLEDLDLLGCEVGCVEVYLCGRIINNCFASGIKYGYPCTDIGITLTAINYDELTSTTFAFEAAAAEAFDKVCNLASPEMLEPVMEVDIESPTEFVGDAMSQITQRGGIISSMEEKSGGNIIHAQAPIRI